MQSIKNNWKLEFNWLVKRSMTSNFIVVYVCAYICIYIFIRKYGACLVGSVTYIVSVIQIICLFFLQLHAINFFIFITTLPLSEIKRECWFYRTGLWSCRGSRFRQAATAFGYIKMIAWIYYILYLQICV